MRTGSTLLPGKRGTRNLVKKHGEALLCVRYRCDADRRKRYKTVELIIDKAPREPPPQPEPRIVGVTVAYEEAELRRQIKAAGGMWNPERRIWELPDYVAAQLHLKSRIVT